MKIGVVIRNARVQAGYSQEGLSILTAMPRQYISKIERDCITPGIEHISRIAAALGVRTSSLISEAEQNESNMIPQIASIQEQPMP